MNEEVTDKEFKEELQKYIDNHSYYISAEISYLFEVIKSDMFHRMKNGDYTNIYTNYIEKLEKHFENKQYSYNELHEIIRKTKIKLSKLHINFGIMEKPETVATADSVIFPRNMKLCNFYTTYAAIDNEILKGLKL
ncbi:hypothetical protein [Liquorilactobacillus hordei]|uniref:hypothetical protein n=1 Tax=Liquorilactobacillus hordei TaxID=468911 RepID=UPI0039EADAEA